MKIRSDYVSNSSSSSFIVVLPKDYSLDTFIREAVKSCSEKKDFDYDVEYIDNRNRINLDYCLNTYQALFLGELECGDYVSEVNGVENCNKVRKIWGVSVGDTRKNDVFNAKIMENKKDHIKFSEPIYISEVVVTKYAMRYKFRPYYGEETKKERKNRLNKIVELSKLRYESYRKDEMDYIHLYEITMDTILNTEELIADKYKIELPSWASDMDSLKKRIKSGDRIFSIYMSQGGDGMSFGKIYATNGWDSDFNSNSNLEVLHGECC